MPIPSAERLGLLIPSKVRTAKIAALETATASKFGELDEPTFREVMAQVRSYLAEA